MGGGRGQGTLALMRILYFDGWDCLGFSSFLVGFFVLFGNKGRTELDADGLGS